MKVFLKMKIKFVKSVIYNAKLVRLRAVIVYNVQILLEKIFLIVIAKLVIMNKIFQFVINAIINVKVAPINHTIVQNVQMNKIEFQNNNVFVKKVILTKKDNLNAKNVIFNVDLVKILLKIA